MGDPPEKHGQYYDEILQYKNFNNLCKYGYFEPNLNFFKDYVNAADEKSSLKSDGARKKWGFYQIAKKVIESSNGIVSDKEQLKKVCEYLQHQMKVDEEGSGKNKYKKHKKARWCVEQYFCNKDINKLKLCGEGTKKDKYHFEIIS